MSNYYHTPYHILEQYPVNKLSDMYSGMVKNKALERWHRIEETSVPYMDKDKHKQFTHSILSTIDKDYKKPHMVSEDELKRVFSNGGR